MSRRRWLLRLLLLLAIEITAINVAASALRHHDYGVFWPTLGIFLAALAVTGLDGTHRD